MGEVIIEHMEENKDIQVDRPEEKEPDYCSIGMSHCICCGWKGKYPVSGCPSCGNSFVS